MKPLPFEAVFFTDMSDLKLYMVLLGCKPNGRNTEQHDLFFGIGSSLTEIKNDILDFWKEANGKLHIDAWRKVQFVDGYTIKIVKREESKESRKEKLFFINLGGYKQNEFEEFHYKMITVAADKGMAIQRSRQTAFYRHTGFEGAVSHVDDKFGIDVDDVYEIEDILPAHIKEQYSIQLNKTEDEIADEFHLGYLKLDKI
jgi:Domain of Unknown Function (DUF1543)